MRLTWLALIACLLLAGCGPTPATEPASSPPAETIAMEIAPPTPIPAEGSLSEAAFPSRVLGRDLRYALYLPAGYETSEQRYPVIYLLHGRGDNLASWARIKPDLDELIALGQIPPAIAVLPDASASRRASYFVDSEYAGPGEPGQPVETALIQELIPHIDAAYRTLAERNGRALGGYSMGGYGALRYALAYPELFAAAIVLSPAVYVPLPPADSSAREFGAFGRGEALFAPEIYQAKNYPALLETFAAAGLPLRLFLAVGDDEYKNPDPADAAHDIDLETHVLFNRVVRVPNIGAELRVLDGGHGWDVWRPAFREGAAYIFRYLRPPQ